MRILIVLLAFFIMTEQSWAQSTPLFEESDIIKTAPGLEEYKDIPAGLLLGDIQDKNIDAWGLSTEEKAKPCVMDDCLLFVSRGEYRKALAGLIQGLQSKDLAAYETLGLMYKNGNGVEKNPTRAFELLSFAAEGGRLQAQHNLGSMYFLGEGVDKNAARGLVWLDIATARAVDATQKRKISTDRDSVAQTLLRQERDSAKQQARLWLQKNGEGHLLKD